MTNHEWAELLEYLYESGGLFESDLEGDVEDTPEELRRQLANEFSDPGDSISESEMERILDRLYKNNLVNYGAGESGRRVQLTPTGFEVAHEREMTEDQYEIQEEQANANDRVADFTVILGAAALVQAAESVMTAPKPTDLYLGIFMILILVVAFFALGGPKSLRN
ncbi:hypothetical protein [Halorubellus salinus]|uniref:hypothetical protein n=1 Tax=Halorubellus salinus TaxID=755309 RepID=UPI001D07E8C7|nr:hypothetical protein [Halorubellus salinus]